MGYDKESTRLYRKETAERVKNRVFAGMGLICLHSSHYSKVIQKVVGMTGHLTWGDEVREILETTGFDQFLL